MAGDASETFRAIQRFGLGLRPGDLERIGSGVRDMLREEVSAKRLPALSGDLFQASTKPAPLSATSRKTSGRSARGAPPQRSLRPRLRRRRNPKPRLPCRAALRPRASIPAGSGPCPSAPAAARAAAAAEDLSRGSPRRLPRQAGASRRPWRAAGRVLGQPFRRLGQQGQPCPHERRADGARSHPPPCLWALRRHAGRGGKPPGHDLLPRQPALDRPELARRRPPRPGAEREPRPRNPGAAHARRLGRLQPGRCDLAGPHHYRLDAGAQHRPRGPAGAFLFNANMHEPGAHDLLGKTYPGGGFEQGARRCSTSPAIRRPPSTSPSSWSATLSPTSRPSRPSNA